MDRKLILMRHAKSDWDSTADSDFTRPLAARGRRDAPRMGRWLRKSGHGPDLIVSSPATRARETALAVQTQLRDADLPLRYDDRIYAADCGTLLEVLRDVPREARSLLLVGHNPGLQDLLEYLAGASLPGTVDPAKPMPTAALVGIRMPNDWDRLVRDCGHCLWAMRPKQLDDSA